MTRSVAGRDDWFITHGGIVFFLLDPDPGSVSLFDIAHALAHVCRWGGHTRCFYSIAQHSIHVSRLAPPHLAFHALMHDAAEAYVGDVIRPLKSLLPEYKRIELRVEAAIRSSFGLRELSTEDSNLVKLADMKALMTERRDLQLAAFGKREDCVWAEDRYGVGPDDAVIEPLSAEDAKKAFLARFEELIMMKPEHAW